VSQAVERDLQPTLLFIAQIERAAPKNVRMRRRRADRAAT
jgi:hypothetical protein